MSLPCNNLATRLLVSSFLILPGPLAGQVSAPDSTAQAVSDSSPVSTDSAARSTATGATSDTVLQGSARDSSSKADTTRAASDTARPDGASRATRSDSAAPRAPIDSVVSAACAGTGGATDVARDLLVIIFAPGTRPAERAAVAKTVRGKLLGAVSSEEPEAYYLRVPSRGDEYRLRVAADKLIQLEVVRQVGSRACPSRSPRDTARPQSS